ncbi:SIR2 family protein [Rouxiella silvae]|uniref:SIR2 family protein n=1 Tax=Rouxiella silvae TaxID=1646373 RepID=A0AA41BVU3_9GAMM|nr:SIR2 family protein [Rouxiella silvae]MBF6636194.1 SIR2 family protein [Rouxiella silvae]
MSKKISLVIGNGFSINFNNFYEPSSYKNTNEPLQWNVPTPGNSGQLIDHLPSLNKLRKAHPELGSFDLFKMALDENHCKAINEKIFDVKIECRHYLTIAFSYYSLLQKKLLTDDWLWFRWLELYKSKLVSISSYNYDLLMETLLDKMKVKYVDITKSECNDSLILHKPHGSCSYEIHPRTVFTKRQYPLSFKMDDCDATIVQLPYDELITPRILPLSIIPNEEGFYHNHTSIGNQNRLFNRSLNKNTHCLFIGNSYMDCDRGEINEVLSSLPPSCKVIVANPYPSVDFIEKLKSMNLEYECWTSLHGPVDENHQLILL